jgi:hypothetical protein
MLTSEEQNKWQGRLQVALGEQAKHHRRWRDSLDFLRLSWFDKNLGLEALEKTEVHWAWVYFNTLVPTLYAHDPHLFVKPRNVHATPFAETMEEVLNYHVSELLLKDSVQRAIADAVAMGLGWLEVGYHPRDSERKELSRKRKPSIMEEIRVSVNKALNPEEDAELSARGQLLPERKEGALYARWLPAWSVLLAPGYHLVRQMPYLIVQEDIELEELQNDPKMDSSVLRNVKPTRQVGGRVAGETSTPQPRRMGSFSFGGAPRFDFVRTHTVWDRRKRQVFTLAEGTPTPLHWQRWPSSFDEFPQVPLIFNDTPPSEDDSYAYPMDDITPIKPQLLEKSLLRTSMIKGRRRLAPFIVVDTDLYQDDDIKKLQESEEFIVIPLRGGGKGITPVTLTIPKDLFNVDGVIDNDLNTVSGFNQLFIGGQQPKGEQTATAASIAQSGTNLRTSRKVDILEDFVVQVARRMAATCWEYCGRDQIAEELGTPVSEEMWPELPDSEVERQRQINKELSFNIEANSTQPEQVRLVEQNIWIRAFNMIKAVWPDRIKDDVALKQLLKKIGAKDIEAMIKPGDEQEQAVANQENQLMLQGAPQVVSPGDVHSVHIPIHGQASQQSGGNQLIDQHILQHAQMLQGATPGANKGPQQGDVSSPAQAGVPELQREGGENFADLAGQGQSVQQGLGPESSLGL